jgi:hypothetical protein
MALDFFETSTAAAATIGARMPILFNAATTGSPRAVKESQRMVTEKAQAALEGASAAGAAAFDLWLRAATGMSTPGADAWFKVAEAAFAPTRRACHANARRLSAPRKRRRR